MQILIDIPNVMYKKIISGEYKYWSSFRSIIQHAIPLPEKHGDLIDRDKIGLTDFEIIMCDGDYREGLKILLDKIASVKAIVEATEDDE